MRNFFFFRNMTRKRVRIIFHTLRVYLENERNLTLVSSLLHVHRSTLQYRIEKLEELTELPLDDAELRFYLLCCFRLLDEVREAGDSRAHPAPGDSGGHGGEHKTGALPYPSGCNTLFRRSEARWDPGEESRNSWNTWPEESPPAPDQC